MIWPATVTRSSPSAQVNSSAHAVCGFVADAVGGGGRHPFAQRRARGLRQLRVIHRVGAEIPYDPDQPGVAGHGHLEGERLGTHLTSITHQNRAASHRKSIEQPLGPPNIGRNLLVKGVDVGELALVPQPLHEGDCSLTAIEIARKPKDMRFDSHFRRFAEGGPDPMFVTRDESPRRS